MPPCDDLTIPVYFPFNQDGSLALDQIPKLAAYSESQGVEIVLLGGSTGECLDRIASTAASDIARMLQGKQPKYRINRPRRS